MADDAEQKQGVPEMKVTDKLYNRFGSDVINHMSCVYIADGENSMRALLEKYGPFRKAIEIGTWNGVSSAILSEYCESVECIDIADQCLRETIWEFLGVKNCHYNLVDTDDQKKALVNKLIKQGEVDLVFVDGDHSYDSARFDIDLCTGVPCVLVHDYDTAAFPGVVKAVDETDGYTETSNLFAMIKQGD